MPISKFSICLWFTNQADEAAQFYTSIFPDGKILHRDYYSSAGQEIHGQAPGSVMVVEFEINGQRFTGLNGGPHFKHSEAVSFVIDCDTQEEVDYYWDKLGAGGDENRRQCGWLADKYGVAWQVLPKALKEMLSDDDKEKVQRTTVAMMGMKKMDLAGLRRAFDGEA